MRKLKLFSDIYMYANVFYKKFRLFDIVFDMMVICGIKRFAYIMSALQQLCFSYGYF